MIRLRAVQFLRAADHYHFATVAIGAEPATAHSHDFYEVFWVQEGHGVHRINRRERPVRPGVLIFIRADDVHTFYSDSKPPLKIANAAFRPATWNYLRRRYFSGEPDLFDRRARLPFERTLTPPEWNRLIEAGRALSDPKRSRFTIEKFLLDFARPNPESHLLPGWLQTAVAQLVEPVRFREGTAGFVRLAGRSPEHVAREVRRHLHCTPTDLVNQARLHHAARLLTTTTRPILDICLDCGFENLSYFYKLFRERYGFSPRRYRLQSLEIVGGA